MRTAMANQHPYYDIYVSENNIGFWKVVMEGVRTMNVRSLTCSRRLACTQMERFCCISIWTKIILTFRPRLALSPPYSIRILRNKEEFVTASLIVCSVEIFVFILGNWTVDTATVTVLNCIWSLFLTPDLEDPAYVFRSSNYSNIVSGIWL